MDRGIRGFEPAFLVGIEAVRRTHGPRLAALAGRRLAGFAVVRFVEDGDWFADLPVVLDFDGIRVEVCHWKFDELSISWNEIDTTAAVTGWESSEFTPRWSGDHESLAPLVGRELTAVRLLEWRPRPPGRDMAAGTVAVEFVFGEDFLRIVNGLDENSLETGAAHPDYVRHELTR